MKSDEILTAISEFLEHVENKSTSPHTLVNYGVDLRQFAEYLEGQRIGGFADMDTPQLRAYLRGLFGWGYSKATISRKLSALRSFFAYLKNCGIVAKDPTRLLRGPSAPRSMPKALSMEAVEALFKMASVGEDPVRDSAILEILYGCGLRISELVGLRWDDVDMEERWIVVLGKGSKERRVPFGSYARKALGDLRKDPDWKNPYVFAGRGDKPITVRTVHRIVTSLAARCGLEGVTPHVLRHSCATHLLEKGASLRFVQEFLGHENMATTQIYLTISATWMKESYLASHPRADMSRVEEEAGADKPEGDECSV